MIKIEFKINKAEVFKISRQFDKKGIRKDKRYKIMLRNMSYIKTEELYDSIILLAIEYEIDVFYLIENMRQNESNKRNLIVAVMMRYSDDFLNDSDVKEYLQDAEEY